MKASALLLCVIVILNTNLHAQISDFISTDFNKADSLADLYPNHSLKDLKNLADKLTRPLSKDEEKFRAIYKWICNNIEYDYPLFKKNKIKREKLKSQEELQAWNKEFSFVIFKNLINNKKTTCTGFAYLLRELAFHAGLPCVIINGYGRTSQANIRGSGIANHSWNAIQLYNKWYLCDATWSGGIYDPNTSKYVKKFDDMYFLTDPSLFILNHFPLDSAWMLLTRKPTLKEFLNRPLIYSSAIKYNITHLVPETFDISTKKGESVSFQFTGNINQQVELNIKETNNNSSVDTSLCQDTTGAYCIDYVFNTKGTYTVHFLLNESYVFTYNVKVR